MRKPDFGVVRPGETQTGRATLKNMFVCCLATQNFQAELVGRKTIFFGSFQEKDTILGLNCFFWFFVSKMTKKILGQG